MTTVMKRLKKLNLLTAATTHSNWPNLCRWNHVHVRYMLSPVRLSSVCLSSVTFVHPTQPVEILGNISTPFGTLAIRWQPRQILRRSSQGNPSGGGVKCKRGSQI